MIDAKPRFVQGTFSFNGAGYDYPVTLAEYVVASDKRAQPIYLRAGNSCAEMINLVLGCDGKALRLFPVGAKGAAHVQLAVVEDLQPDSRITIAVSAPAGVAGTVVVDFGMVEI